MLSRRGFTIIEVVIVIGIASVVFGIFSSNLVASWNAQYAQEIYGELQRKSRITVDQIADQTREAANVVASISPGGSVYSSSETSIVLRLTPYDTNGNTLPGDDYVILRQHPTETSRTERLIVATAGSVREDWHSPLTLNQSTQALEIHYYNDLGVELTPGVDNLVTTERVQIRSNSSRAFKGRTYSREAETSVILRNKQ